jgi:tetratricopeptide (TPR) repeat protein
LLSTAIQYYENFLAHNRDNSQLMAEVGATYLRLSKLYFINGQPDLGVDALEKGLDLVDTLMERNPSLEELKPLSVGLYRYPRYLLRKPMPAADPPRMKRLVNREVEFWERLAKIYPEVDAFRFDLAGNVYTLSALERSSGDLDGSFKTAQRSIDLFTALVKQYPNRLDYRREASYVLGAVGITHILRGDLTTGIDWQERALDLDPNNTRPLNTIAWNLATYPDPKQRNLPKAIAVAKKAVAAEPRNSNYWNTLGVAYYRSGQYAEALPAFDKSMMLSHGGDGFDWFYIAMVHWKLHNPEKAIDYLQKAQDWKRTEHVSAKDLLGIDEEAQQLIVTNTSQKTHP